MSTALAPPRAARARGMKHRSTAVILGALVAATAAAVLAGGGVGYDAALDPQNADPAGARAVAQVLADQGVEVEIVRDAAAFLAARVDTRTTVLITGTEALGRSTAGQVLDRRPERLVLAEPRLAATDLFGIPDGLSYSGTESVQDSCSAVGSGDLRVESREGTAYPAEGGSCFRTGDGALLTRPTSTITVLGAADVLRNDQVTRADNAALVLRLLGERPRLVWYVPDVADLSGADQVTLASLLPRWLGPTLLLCAVALLGVIGWRGRRLGPLVSEPLPAAVNAIESTSSRGRLYRKAADRAYAANALRNGARREIADHLRLPRTDAGADPLVAVLAARTSRSPEQLRQLLDPSSRTPRNDRELVTLANDLAELSREVRRP